MCLYGLVIIVTRNDHGLSHSTSVMKCYTGWMYQSVSRSSYACLSTSVCMELWDHRICRRCACRSRRCLAVVICVLLFVDNLPFLVTDLITTAGKRAFSFAGPSAWNSLPTYLNDHTLNLDSFKRFLKSFLF